MTDDEELRELVELDRCECLQLLAGGIIGRVICTDSALPTAQPVNYILDGEEIIFLTGGWSKLAAATNTNVVAFQTDQIDPATRTGWSVLGIGQAHQVTDAARLAELAHRQQVAWAPGETTHTITIPLWRLTGRRLWPTRAEPTPSARRVQS